MTGTPLTLSLSRAGFGRPFLEIDRSGKRRQQDELGERQVGLLSASSTVASKVSARSVGSPKMNEPSTWTPWWRNARSRVDQCVAREVEVLVDGLQAFRRSPTRRRPARRGCGARFIASRNAGSSAGFHRDLGVEDHVDGRSVEPRHQLEAFARSALELVEPRRILAALGRARGR